MTDRLLTDLRDGVLTLTLNRPEKRNAIDTPMMDAILAGLDRADLDAGVRVVALRGAGKDFCAGADLDELLASADRTPDQNRESALHFGTMFVRMRQLPKPVVAIVHGRCLAGGMGLATGADMIVAHAGSVFGYPEIQRGFVPAIVMTMLRRAVGEKIAFDLAATGRTMTAAEAAGVGLVSRVLAADAFEAGAGALLAQLAGFGGTALALTKRQFYAVDGKQFETGIRLAADVNALARSTPEFRQSIAQFLKK